MNVTVRPLVWRQVGADDGKFVAEAIGHEIFVVREWGTGVWWCYKRCHKFCGADYALDGRGTFDEARLAAERWYTAKVLDCLEPADPAAAAEFVTAYAQCAGEYDDKGVA